MRKIYTEIIIEADLNKSGSFSNFEIIKLESIYKSIKCDGNVGNSVTVTLCPPGGKSMTFKPTLLKFDKTRIEMERKVLINGVFWRRTLLSTWKNKWFAN